MDKQPLKPTMLSYQLGPIVHVLECGMITSTQGERHVEEQANSTREGLGLNLQQ